jgi:RND family efflux transporter MFP subunit
MRLRRLLVVSLALAAGACRGGAGARAEAAAVEVRCVEAKTTPIDETVLLRGRVETPPGGDLPVASQIAGRIDTVLVREGQHVARGDEIALVDDEPTRDAARQADANVTQAKAAAENAQTTLARITLLVNKGIAAKQELDDARARADAAKAAVSAAGAASSSAHFNLRRVSVRSSFAGVITRIFRGPGALVDGTAQTPIAQLAAEGAVELVADVTEGELMRTANGQKAAIVFPWGAPETTGVVRARSSALDTATGLGFVRIALDRADVPIGAFGRAVVTVAHRDARVLPTSALRGPVADGAEVVRCNADGKAELVPIHVGWRSDASFEVTSGLGPHDRVAVDHVLGLDNGTPIAQATEKK